MSEHGTSVARGEGARNASELWYFVESKFDALNQGADYFGLLDVDRNAGYDAVEAKEKELLELLHPGAVAMRGLTPEARARLQILRVTIQKAAMVLKDPEQRLAYEKALAMRGRKAPGATAPLASTQTSQPSRVTARLDQTKAPVRPGDERAKSEVEYMRELARTSARTTPLPNVAGAAPSPAVETPRSEVRPLPSSAAEWMAHGRSYAAAGDFDRASRAFQRAAELSPYDPVPLAWLGRALARLPGRHKQAELAFTRAIEHSPLDATIRVDLAELYERFGRANDARTLYEKALAIDRDNARAQAGLARIGGRPGTGSLGTLWDRLRRGA